MNNTINTGVMSNGNFTIQYQQNGNGGCIPVIDGKPEPSLMFGYATESDKQACIKLIEDALRATGNDIPKVRQYIMNAVKVSANEIKADEAIEVDGVEIIIDYTAKKAYKDAKEIANLNDMQCFLPNEVIKAMLINRVQLAFAEREVEYYDEDEYDDYDDDDYIYDGDEDLMFIS